ncbi:MAG: hypothetical protein P4L83_14270 [Nevskia sp.]|nr:hypothetical protein [Nevskia sp.]
MDLSAPIRQYCERLGPGLWAEPLNAVSNLAFLLAAAWLLSRPSRQAPAYARVLAVLLFLIGLGSLSFHLFATAGTEILDVLFIALYVLFFVACYFRRFGAWPWWAALLAMPGFVVFGALVMAPFPQGALNGSVGYLPALAGLVLMAGYLLAKRRRGGGPLAAAAAIFLVSLYLRTEDRAWCLSLPIGTHWLWHCLNAGTLTLVTLSLDYEPDTRHAGASP